MAKVNIIIRAYNRLEYTSLTIREIDKLAGYDDYKMIVVDNASTDGTDKWLNSLVCEDYYKIKPIYLKENLGDFGGMKIGYDNLDDDCAYAMQWDNDCPPMDYGFLDKMVKIMDEFPKIGQLMLKRTGVGHVINIINKTDFDGVIFGDVNMVTCVNMHRADVVKGFNYWVTEKNTKEYWDFKINKLMLNNGYELKKIENYKVNHVDIYIDKGVSYQLKKYSKYIYNRKNINYTEVLYETK